MTFITRTASAFAILGSVFVSTTALAMTPFDAATLAYGASLKESPATKSCKLISKAAVSLVRIFSKLLA